MNNNVRFYFHRLMVNSRSHCNIICILQFPISLTFWIGNLIQDFSDKIWVLQTTDLNQTYLWSDEELKKIKKCAHDLQRSMFTDYSKKLIFQNYVEIYIQNRWESELLSHNISYKITEIKLHFIFNIIYKMYLNICIACISLLCLSACTCK